MTSDSHYKIIHNKLSVHCLIRLDNFSIFCQEIKVSQKKITTTHKRTLNSPSENCQQWPLNNKKHVLLILYNCFKYIVTTLFVYRNVAAL